jgi:DNA-binding response OmpR family regulator
MPRALVVEDETDIRNYLRVVLDGFGYVTTAVATHSDGHEALETESFDLVIADAHLGDGTGVDLVAEGSARGAKTILISGHPPSIRRLNELGIPYLQKPFGVPELTVTLQHLMRRQ